MMPGRKKGDAKALRRFSRRNIAGRFLADENGATSIEYGLIITFIALVIIAGATLIGQNTSASFDRASDGFN